MPKNKQSNLIASVKTSNINFINKYITNSGICNYILFNKLPWPRDIKGTFRSSIQAATCPPVYHTRRRLHTVPFNCWTSSKKAVNTNFSSLWFDPIGDRTRVYCFSSRRSIHSTTDGFRLSGGGGYLVLVNYQSLLSNIFPLAPPIIFLYKI